MWLEVLINNLGAILTGAALFLTALTAFVSVWRNGNKIDSARTDQAVTSAKLQSIEGKVDGGVSQLQTSLADIAKIMAQAATGTQTATQERKIRESDKKTDEAKS